VVRVVAEGVGGDLSVSSSERRDMGYVTYIVRIWVQPRHQRRAVGNVGLEISAEIDYAVQSPENRGKID
jgi:hypothetical protein